MGAMDWQNIPQLAYLGVLLMALLGYALVAYRRSFGRMMRHGALWFFIFIGMIAAVGLWNDFRQAAHGLAQFRAQGAEIILPRAIDGHYYLVLQVNAQPVLFLIDTGASQIVLSRDDALRAGFDVEGLIFSGRANTANGRISTAPVRIAELGLGTELSRDVAAVVNGGAMEHSLLGMDFLQRFSRITIEQGKMTLTR